MEFKYNIGDKVKTFDLGVYNLLVEVKILDCFIGENEPYYRVQETKRKERFYYRNESEIKK